jgi:hypothetical protein
VNAADVRISIRTSVSGRQTIPATPSSGYFLELA